MNQQRVFACASGGSYKYSKSWKPAYEQDATVDQNEPKQKETSENKGQEVILNTGDNTNPVYYVK